MLRTLFLLLVSCNFLFANSIKVMTYNLRYDNAGDGVNQWGKRTKKVNDLIHKYAPDILSVQEGLNNQVDDMQTMLPDFFHVGVGRDDGKTKGEFSAIFFRKNLFELISTESFWLSPTPSVAGSKGWDAALTRICTYAKIKSKKDGKIFFVFNTHFDHQGDSARKQSARLIIQKIKELAGNLPVILTGDFNSEPSSSAYQTIISNTIHPLFDSYTKQPKDCTYTGFSIKNEACKRIDFIFSDKNFNRISYHIIDDNDGQFYPSDHEAVEAEFDWKKN